MRLAVVWFVPAALWFPACALSECRGGRPRAASYNSTYPRFLPLLAPPLMEAFWVATGVVALGEIGDKTQLLALVLTARFRRPLPIIAGILVATLANHALAGVMGGMIRAIMPADLLRWLVALAFFAVALWALRPDQLEEEEDRPRSRWGIFGIVTAMFFAAEMGDKTQVATILLAAQYPSLIAVILGTTLGMLLANVPVVLFGNAMADKVPLGFVRYAAAALFIVMGLYALFFVDFGQAGLAPPV